MSPMEATHLALDRAVLCVGCSRVSDATGETCPACGAQGLLSLARALNRRPLRIASALAPWTAWRESRRVSG